MKSLTLAKFTRVGILVTGLAISMATPLLAQNTNTVNRGTTTGNTTAGNTGTANRGTTGNTNMAGNTGTTANTMPTSTPVQTNTNTTRTQTTEVRTERERGFPWGLLGLLGLAGLIPRKRKEVEVAEFRDTRPKEIRTEVRTETRDTTTTRDNTTTDNQTNS